MNIEAKNQLWSNPWFKSEYNKINIPQRLYYPQNSNIFLLPFYCLLFTCFLLFFTYLLYSQILKLRWQKLLSKTLVGWITDLFLKCVFLSLYLPKSSQTPTSEFDDLISDHIYHNMDPYDWSTGVLAPKASS